MQRRVDEMCSRPFLGGVRQDCRAEGKPHLNPMQPNVLMFPQDTLLAVQMFAAADFAAILTLLSTRADISLGGCFGAQKLSEPAVCVREIPLPNDVVFLEVGQSIRPFVR